MAKRYMVNEISEILNPPLTTKFVQKHQNSLEDVYASRRKAPLGRSPLSNIDCKNLMFGIVTSKDGSVADAFPVVDCKLSQSVYKEIFKPFNGFYEKDAKINPAGLKLEGYDISGNNMREIFTIGSAGDSAVIVPTSEKDLYSKGLFVSKECHYNVHEPNKLRTEKNEMYDNVHSSKIQSEKYPIEVLWNKLKIKNLSNFKDFSSAFKSYQNERGNITVSDLHKMCQKFGISVPLHVVEELLKKCDIIDKDGTLNYQEFVHCLNWKDILPENFRLKSSKYANDWREGNFLENSIENYKTTYSTIGDHKSAVPLRAAGVSSQKNDNNYDHEDSEAVSSLMHPSVFKKHGVSKVDLGVLRSKEEVKIILDKSGICLKSEAFDKIWGKVNNKNQASIGIFWNTLKKICMTQNKLFP